MGPGLKILFAGPLAPWNSTDARRRALVELGHSVTAVDLSRHRPPGPGLAKKVVRHLHVGPGIAAYNREVIQQSYALRPDVVWLDQPLQVWPQTLRAIRSSSGLILGHNSEFIGFRKYWFRHYLRALGLFDVHVVTNELTASLLQRRGAKKIVRSGFGYDPPLHRPLVLTEDEGKKYHADALFVGHWEPTTEAWIVELRRVGIDARVYGPNWHRATGLTDRRRISTIYGEDYVKALCGAKICLGFLSKWNHNQASLRTFEIPAAGGFLLAERTELHRSYYEEGHEAEFFSSSEELVRKSQHYLANDGARSAIARAGHKRSLSSPYTQKDNVQRILDSLST